ncbi:zinc finger protein 583 isoform X3 [Phlebotomus papatasi]|uniref:zinc finger protein 583 isoform X3 n=1 Tax=Phlebotomus papatasi TaxID=29031 RepID=UPI0024841F19|nr:zinc finger protein 583 isoform X3 [Phlebotomus papatasi]
MENLCGICFQQAEQLYQVPGYPIPSCLKCSEQLAMKGLSGGVNPRGGVQEAGGISNPTPAPTSNHPPPNMNGVNVSDFRMSPKVPPPPTNSTPCLDASQEVQQTQILQQGPKKHENLPFDLEQTIQNIDNELLYGEEGSCPLCSKTFGRKSSLLNHIRNHSAEKKYVCSYCQKGFTQAANLRNHERIHTNERPYVCIDCGKAFTQVTNLNNHRRLHTGERPFVCIEPDCGRSFAQVTNLNNHMKTHHKVQQYVCNQCPRRFIQVSQLNQHLALHTGIRGFMCPHCPEKTFKQQSHLQQHLRTHGLEFPYACGRCEEKFVQFVHLEHHMKMHEEYRFKCTMCNSAFNQEALLKKHIQRHIDGRYITCPVEGCSEGFTVKHHLTRHMQSHHSMTNHPKRISVKRLKMSSYCRSAASGKYNCYFESCEESFGDSDSLNEHLRSVHGLSIVKNATKRTKVDVSLLEHMKNSAGVGGGVGKNPMTDAGLNFATQFAAVAAAAGGMVSQAGGSSADVQQHQQQVQQPGDVGNKRVLSVSEMLKLSEEDMRKQMVERKAQMELDMQIKCENLQNSLTTHSRSQHVTNFQPHGAFPLISNGGPGMAGVVDSVNAMMKLVCHFCFNIFKSPHSLARHIQKFHN